MLNRMGVIGPFVFVVAAAVGCGAPPANSEDPMATEDGDQIVSEQTQEDQAAPQEETANTETGLTNGTEEDALQQQDEDVGSAVSPQWRHQRRPRWGWGRPGRPGRWGRWRRGPGWGWGRPGWGRPLPR
jgi:hypothetical protein